MGTQKKAKTTPAAQRWTKERRAEQSRIMSERMKQRGKQMKQGSEAEALQAIGAALKRLPITSQRRIVALLQAWLY